MPAGELVFRGLRFPWRTLASLAVKDFYFCVSLSYTMVDAACRVVI
jgi:hypothetical protein